MSRRRFRANLAPPPTANLQIGVTMTPIAAAPSPCPATSSTPAPGGCEVSGPFSATGVAPYIFGQPCGWLVYMLGIGPDDAVEWAMTWDGMESNPGDAYFMLAPEAFADAPMAAQVISTISFSVSNIQVFCTVNGTAYGPLVLACLA